MLHVFLNGAVFFGNLVIALLFLRFYRKSRDRFFVFFSVAFAALAVHRAMFLAFKTFDDMEEQNSSWLYVIRLAAYVLIIVAILDKNHAAKRQTSPRNDSTN